VPHRIGPNVAVASITLTSALVNYALTAHWSLMVALNAAVPGGIGPIDAGINTYIANKQRNATDGAYAFSDGIGALLGP